MEQSTPFPTMPRGGLSGRELKRATADYGSLHIALFCARMGWRVLPVNKKGEAKLSNWPENATTDPKTIEEWFGDGGRYARHNVAVVTGRESGFWVTDLDVKNGPNGIEAFERLAQEHDEKPVETLVIDTPSGGRHLLWAYPDDIEIKTAKNLGADGIDTRGWHGYIVAPFVLRSMSMYAPRKGCRYEDDLWAMVDGERHAERLVLPRAPGWWEEMATRGGKGGVEEDLEYSSEKLGSVEELIEEASVVAPGDQEDFLFRFLCKLRGQNRSPQEMEELGCLVASRFVNVPGHSKGDWTSEHVVDKVRHVCESFEPELIDPELEAWAWRVHNQILALPETSGEDTAPSEMAAVSGAGAAVWKPNDASEDSRGIVYLRASQIVARPTYWLWDTTKDGETPTSGGRMPKDMLTMAAGLPGTAKSQYAVWTTAQVTRGTLPGCFFGRPKNVIYAATEDDWSRTIAPRLIAAGADLDRVLWIKMVTCDMRTLQMNIPEDHENIGKFAQAHDVALLVLDPLLSHLGGKIDANKEADVRKAVEPLVRAAAEYEFTVLGISHFNKNSSDTDPMNRLMGSRGFSALLRALIVFAEDKDAEEDGAKRYVLSQGKNNLGRTDMPSFSYTIQPMTVSTTEGNAYVSRFALGEETDTSVSEQLANSSRSSEEREVAKDCKSWLLEHLVSEKGADTRQSIMAAAKKQGFNDTAVDRAGRSLKVKKVSTGFGTAKVSMWGLPDM